MERKLIKINNNEYEFLNKSWETYNSWGHETWVLRNGYEVGHNRVRYYNRTWECYKYQTCMQGAIYTLIEERKEVLKTNFKNERDIKRLSEKTKKELESIYESDEILKELVDVKEML